MSPREQEQEPKKGEKREAAETLVVEEEKEGENRPPMELVARELVARAREAFEQRSNAREKARDGLDRQDEQMEDLTGEGGVAYTVERLSSIVETAYNQNDTISAMSAEDALLGLCSIIEQRKSKAANTITASEDANFRRDIKSSMFEADLIIEKDAEKRGKGPDVVREAVKFRKEAKEYAARKAKKAEEK